MDAVLSPDGLTAPDQTPASGATQPEPVSADASRLQDSPKTEEDVQSQETSPQGTPGPAPSHHRKAPVYVAAGAVAVAALALGLVVWGVSSGGSSSSGQDASQTQPAADNSNDSNSTDNANASAGAATTSSNDNAANAAGNAAADGPQSAQSDASPSGNANAPVASSNVSVTIARLNGWWTTFGNLPINPYTYFKDGVAYVYSHEGELEGTWTPQEGRRASATELGESGTIITSSASPDAFYLLRDTGDILDSHWYEGGKLQYSGSDSLTRCGGDAEYAVPSFASKVEAAVASGQSQPASQPAADDSFQQQKPTITGWTQQPVPLGDGVIYRVAWTPIDGAEGYELRRWDLSDKWYDFPLQTLTSPYYDCGSSDSDYFGAQVRAYKTVGGSRVYSQWSDRSNFDVPGY